MLEQSTAISLLGGDSVDKTADYRDALSINMVAIVKVILGAKGYMLMHSGLTFFATGEGIDRGGVWNERLLAHVRVSGQSLIALDAGGSTRVLGTINGLDTASLPYSFNTQAVIADGKFFLYDPVNGFRQVVDVLDPVDPTKNSIVGEPIDGVFIDGYYFLTDGENLYHTELKNEARIEPLSFGTAEISPDTTLGLGVTVDNKVMVFGRYSIEYFTNVATANFAFTRVRGRAIKTGIVGTHCKVEIDNVWYIMGGRHEADISIHAVGVGNATSVASREVDKVIGKYTEAQLRTSVLEGRIEDEQYYLIVHLPNDTLMLNLKLAQSMGVNQAWTILRSDAQGDQTWRGKHGVFDPRVSKFMYGDKQNANIGLLDDTVTTHYGNLTEYVMFTPFIQLEEMSIDEIDIETVAGFTVDKDATVAVSLTNDGQHYGKEWWAQYGQPSEYLKRFIVRRLGYIRNFFGLKVRIVSRSRMAFSILKMKFG